MADRKDTDPHRGQRRTMPGLSRHQAGAARKLANAVRETIDPQIFVDFHMAIWMGKPACLAEEDGVLTITWDDRGGVVPTLEQRIGAARWLAERGHGMPVQSIVLEADLRASITHTEIAPGALTLEQIIAIRSVMGARAPAKVIEATSTEHLELELASVEDDEPAE